VFVIFIPLYVASAVLFGLSTRPTPPRVDRYRSGDIIPDASTLM
jgi:hypothetical protein